MIAERPKGQLDIDKYKELNKETTWRCIGIQAPYNDATPQGMHWVGVAGTTFFNGKDWFIISPTSDNDTTNKENPRFREAGWIREEGDPVRVYIPVSKITGHVIFSLKQ